MQPNKVYHTDLPQRNPEQTTSPFLRLPAEIRNHIYAFAFGHRTAEISGCVFPPNPKNLKSRKKEEDKLSLLFAPSHTNRSTYIPSPQPHTFALRSTCRQLYSEVVGDRSGVYTRAGLFLGCLSSGEGRLCCCRGCLGLRSGLAK
jgi:hypothetical protein